MEDLPGFRFHPTEEELLDFYLKKVAYDRKVCSLDIIGTLNLYSYDPWDLPSKAKIGEREWYFFVPRDRKQAGGGRPNRTTEKGYWKATGSDRPVRSASDLRRVIGLKKTLVFYLGRAPSSRKTEWVMNEYRLPETSPASASKPPKEDIVLCKVYRKATSLKELEQRAAMELDGRDHQCKGRSPADQNYSPSLSSSSDQDQVINPMTIPLAAAAGYDDDLQEAGLLLPKGELEKVDTETSSSASVSPEGVARGGLPELELLQVPQNHNWDWLQDPFLLSQLRSPWLLDALLSPSNILNF